MARTYIVFSVDVLTLTANVINITNAHSTFTITLERTDGSILQSHQLVEGETSFSLTQTETSYTTFNYLIKINGAQTDTYEAVYLPTPTYDVSFSVDDLTLTANVINIINAHSTFTITLERTDGSILQSHQLVGGETSFSLTQTETSYTTFNYVIKINGTQTHTYEAVYVVPYTNIQKLTGEASNDYFGYSASIDGDYAIVGAYRKNSYTGSVYIYIRSGTSWTQQASFAGGAANEKFGYSVSISGDYAIVGAYHEATGGSNSGAVYIYKRTGTTWSYQQKIKSSDAASGDEFGCSVSMSGDYAIVGAQYEDPNGTLNSGSVYMYTRDPSTGLWGSEQKIYASDVENFDIYGSCVSMSGDYAIVGAYGEDPNGLATAGSAYIYTRNSSTGLWGSEQKIYASDGRSYSQYGQFVSIEGNYAIVGKPTDSPDGVSSSAGSAYIYTRNSSTGLWGSEQKITADVITANERFGSSVSISENCAIVGAWNPSSSASTYTGAAYIYTRSGTTWTQQEKLNGEAVQDYFGSSVSQSGGYAIVGAYANDTAFSDAGAAYIYTI